MVLPTSVTKHTPSLSPISAAKHTPMLGLLRTFQQNILKGFADIKADLWSHVDSRLDAFEQKLDGCMAAVTALQADQKQLTYTISAGEARVFESERSNS